MNITVNDVNMTVPDVTTVQDVLELKDIKPQGIATALNGRVIPAHQRATTPLTDGDKIVIIKAFYGG